MPTISEVGHARNVANFYELIALIKTQIPNYDHPNPDYQIPQLEAKVAAAEQILSNVVAINATYNSLVNERKLAFKDMKNFASRVFLVLQSFRPSEEILNDAKGFTRKIKGQRATLRTTIDTQLAVATNNKNSVSQQSYIQLVQHFDGLIAVLDNAPTYTPNQIELQVASLRTQKEDLARKNQAVITAQTQLLAARNMRNSILYTSSTSIYNLATDIKKYIKGCFGTKSHGYIQISRLKFTKPKI